MLALSAGLVLWSCSVRDETSGESDVAARSSKLDEPPVGVEPTPDFSWEISLGKLRREIALSMKRSFNIVTCFGEEGHPPGEVIRGGTAYNLLSNHYSSITLAPYAAFLQHPGSFAVRVDAGAQGVFIAIPHPNTTTLQSPSTENFLTILPLAEEDPPCLHDEGTRGSNGGPIDEWCRCNLTGCTWNCPDGCGGSAGQLDELAVDCINLERFTDDESLYSLSFGEFI